MKLLQRRGKTHDYDQARPLPDEAVEPQPEHEEPKLAEPGPTDLSKRDYIAIVRRAFKQAMKDHITNIAAALAYYAFLAIPSALLLGLGLFSLIAGPHAVTTIVDKLGTVMPSQATSLIKGSLKNMTQKDAAGAVLIGIGGLLPPLSLRGAVENLLWGP